MNAWIAMLVGVAVGLFWKRFRGKQAFEGLTDVFLGITGAFAARWVIDSLSRMGVRTHPYEPVFILGGAALISLMFHLLGRSSQVRKQHRIDRWGRPLPPDTVVEADDQAGIPSQRKAA